MWTRRIPRDSRQLRESYLGIYRYVRRQQQTPASHSHRHLRLSSISTRVPHSAGGGAFRVGNELRGQEADRGVFRASGSGRSERSVHWLRRSTADAPQHDIQRQIQDLEIGEETNNAPKDERISPEAISYIREWKRRRKLGGFVKRPLC